MFLSGSFLVVQQGHLHQPARAAHARKSAGMVSANTVSILPKVLRLLRHHRRVVVPGHAGVQHPRQSGGTTGLTLPV